MSPEWCHWQLACQCSVLDNLGMHDAPVQHPNHRKLVRHFDQPGQAHELTFSCYRRLPALDTDERRTLLSRCMDSALAGREFELIAFVGGVLNIVENRAAP